MPSLTNTIGEFITKTSLDDVPHAVVCVAKNAIIDSIAVTIPGSREEAGLIIQKYVQEVGGIPTASVIGTDIKTTGPFAALANGVAAHVLDFDDVNSILIGHPSVVLMPTVIAAGELTSSSGEAVLLGYILGFEIMVKLSSILNPRHYEHGWHSTSTFGALGAAAAASKIFGLKKEQTQCALGLATSLAGGVRRNFGTMTKSFHAGNAARAGLESALLCRQGFTAHTEILDQSMGFLDVFGEIAEDQRAAVSETLGNPYELVSSGVDLKRYPCCGGALAAVDAAIAIRNKRGFSLNDVEAVECGENALGPRILVYSDPQKPLEGKFSMEYCVCRALLDGRLGLEEFTDEKVQDPALRALLKRTRAYVHPELEDVKLNSEDRVQRFPAIVTVRLRDGTELTESVVNAKGRWDNPLNQKDLREKYRLCACAHLKEPQVEKSLTLLERLEDLKDLSELVNHLTP